MKKLFTTLILAVAAVSATSAQNYVIYGDGEPADTRIGIGNINPWGNCTVKELTGEEYPGGKAMKYTVDNDNSYFIAGWFTATDFDYSTIVGGDYDLVFDFKTNIPETSDVCIKIEAEGVNEIPFEVARDNEWHKVRMNLKEKFPDFTNTMRVISLVGQRNVKDSEAYIANIRLEAKKQMPTISATLSDVEMNSAVVSWTTNIPEEYAGQTVVVKFDGEAVEGSSKTLEGLEASTTYRHTLELVVGDYTTATEVVFTTKRDPSKAAVWYGSGESNGYTFDYSLTANPDNTLTVYVDITPAIAADMNVKQMCINDVWGDFAAVSDGDRSQWTYTTKESYTEGQELTMFFYFPPCRVDVQNPKYVFGASNEVPKSLRLTASAENITETSADIRYALSMPSDWNSEDVRLFMDDVEIDRPEGDVISLTGLNPSTQYTRTLRAEIETGGETIVSKDVTVSFTTLRPAGHSITHYQILNGLATDVPLKDADNKKGTVAYSIRIVALYNDDNTLTYNIAIKGIDHIAGVNPTLLIAGGAEVILNQFKNEDGTYTYTTKRTYGETDRIGNTFFRLAYMGGFKDVTLRDFTPANADDMTAVLDYGEAASVEMVKPDGILKAGVEYFVPINVKDAAGNYLTDLYPQISSEDLDFVKGFATASAPGTYTLHANLDGTVAADLAMTFIHADAVNIVSNADVKVYAPTAVNIGHAFDGNFDTMVEFPCNETEEHELIIDLGKNYDVHALELIWEGASAKDYTVTFHVSKDCAWYEGADRNMAPVRRAASSDAAFDNMGSTPMATYEVVNGDGGAGKNVTETFVDERQGDPLRVQYVRLATKTATDKTWGMKLREMSVHATEVPADQATTGIEDVAADTAVSRTVFNLQGMPVLENATAADFNNLPAGLYIFNGRKYVVR